MPFCPLPDDEEAELLYICRFLYMAVLVLVDRSGLGKIRLISSSSSLSKPTMSKVMSVSNYGTLTAKKYSSSKLRTSDMWL